MATVLISYHSETGNTELLAQGVAAGVRSVPEVICLVKKISETTTDDLLEADGIIIGSPTYFGIMSAEVKKVFDLSESVYGKMEGKVGGAFTTSGGLGSGHESTNLSIIMAMLVSGMVIPGITTGPHYGPFAAGKPTQDNMNNAQEMGKKIAELTRKLFPREF